jgi:molecular chaperone DnaK (HSP70)
VGGPTRLPLIRKAVGDYFQSEPKTEVDPDEVVAMGAAIHASSLASPDQGAYLLDVTPLSLRIGVAGGLAETVIERNTPVPIEQTRTFTTFQDYQERVKIRVFQGESRQAEENERLGQFEFAGFRKARRGEVEIDVTFAIDSDGLVRVTACDRATGQQASTEITLSSGLSESEIEGILDKGATDRVQTATADDVAAQARGEAPAATPPAPQAAPQARIDEDELETLDDADLDDLEVLDEGGDEESIELVDGVQTPPAELRGNALDLDTDSGDPGDPVPIDTETPSTPDAEADAGETDARDAYLGQASGDLSGSDDPESGSK